MPSHGRRTMRMSTSPHSIAAMVDGYVRSQSVLMVSRSDVRRFMGSRPWLARAFAWRGPLMRRLRRYGNAKYAAPPAPSQRMPARMNDCTN